MFPRKTQRLLAVSRGTAAAACFADSFGVRWWKAQQDRRCGFWATCGTLTWLVGTVNTYFLTNMFPIRKLLLVILIMLSHVSLHFLIFQSLPPDFTTKYPPFGSKKGHRVTGLCLLCRFLCLDQVLPCLGVWAALWLLSFLLKVLVWHDMHGLSQFALFFFGICMVEKAPEDQRRPTIQKKSPLSVTIQKNHCIWGACSIIAEVISAFSARSCACVPSARECNKIPSVSMQGSIMPCLRKFGEDLDLGREAAITTLTFEKPPSEGGTANYITWLTWHEVLSCMKFLGDGREHLFQQLFILWTWHLNLDLLDLEDSTEHSGPVTRIQ